MSKVYVAKVIELEDGDSVLEFPRELIAELNWKPGDRLSFDILKDSAIIINFSAQFRNNLEENV